jgi:hypothetical protein
VIAPQSEGKGRAFRAIMLAHVEADGLWAGGTTNVDNRRPVWAMFAGSEQELRPFTANLMSGRKAEISKGGSYSRKNDRIEFLKSAGFQFTWQREEEGSVVTAFLPDLFRMDPGMVDKAGANFILLPTVEWLSAQNIDSGPIVAHAEQLHYPVKSDQLAAWVPMSFLFAAYLDRRTRCPLLSDARFYLQLMLAFLNRGCATISSDSEPHYYGQRPFGANWRFIQDSTKDVGLADGIAFRAEHDTIEQVLAEQVSVFFKITKGE